MNVLLALGARLRSRSDSEHEQAIVRIVIAAYVLGLVVWKHSTSGLPLMVLGVYVAVAIVIFICICIWPAANVPRRVISMLADVGLATAVMFLTDEIGFLMIGVYLFITFGNGFRYGIPYLFACGLLCIAGFTAVLNYAPFWQSHVTAGICLMVTLIILPLYVATLHRRAILQEQARTEQALRECLARQQHQG